MFQDATVHQTFAFFLGVYFLAAGAGVLIDRQTYIRMLADLEANAALTFLIGAFAFLVGALIVALHNDWSGAARIAVSLVGWASLLKGLALMVWRGRMLDLYARLQLGPPFATGAGIAALLVGLWLVTAGLSA